jgi:hypothetical protein
MFKMKMTCKICGKAFDEAEFTYLKNHGSDGTCCLDCLHPTPLKALKLALGDGYPAFENLIKRIDAIEAKLFLIEPTITKARLEKEEHERLDAAYQKCIDRLSRTKRDTPAWDALDKQADYLESQLAKKGWI